MKQEDLKPPEQGGILSGPRFKAVDKDQWIVIWDMGDPLNKKEFPEIWCGYEYWNKESHEKAEKRLRFLVGLLNGLRQPFEILEID